MAGAVLADDAETLYSEADKAVRSLEKEWGIPCRLVRTEVAGIEQVHGGRLEADHD